MYNFLKWEIISSIKFNNTIISCLGFFIIIFLLSLTTLSNKIMFQEFSYVILWISALLSILLTLDNIFKNDFENELLDLYSITHLRMEIIVIVKMFVHWLTTGFPLTLISLTLLVTIDINLKMYFWAFLSLFFGTLSLTFIGTVASCITIGMKRGTFTLSLLVLPFYFPTLFFGEKILSLSSEDNNPLPSLLCLIGITTISSVMSPLISSTILRIHRKY